MPEVVRCDWSAEKGYEAGLALAARVRAGEGPTAVFAGNDQLALGLLHACAEAGVDVPGRLSVVGFDDVQGSAHFHPPLTTVRQPFHELGRLSLAVMLDAHRRRPVRDAGADRPPGPDHPGARRPVEHRPAARLTGPLLVRYPEALPTRVC